MSRMKENAHLNQVLAVWQTNNRITEVFFGQLSDEVWTMKVPGSPRKTVRMIAGHVHNSRCMWVKMIGRSYGLKPPASVDRRSLTRTGLLRALKRSNKSLIELLKRGIDRGGALTIRVPYANIPSDVTHFAAYLIAHEAHHRGQIVLIARNSGHRLPPEVTNSLWQWKQRRREVTERAAGHRRAAGH